MRSCGTTVCVCMSFALCCLTFDMSGRRKPAQLAFGCPLDGGVRCLSAEHDLHSGSRESCGATRAGVRAGASSDCGSALRYSAGPCAARTLAVVGTRLDAHCENGCWQQRLRARHGHPAESTASKEASRCAASATSGEPTANGRVAQVTVPAPPIFKLPLLQATCTAP